MSIWSSIGINRERDVRAHTADEYALDATDITLDVATTWAPVVRLSLYGDPGVCVDATVYLEIDAAKLLAADLAQAIATAEREATT